jgi:starch synthase
MRILFVSSEIFPFAKTGGLADVSASLPRALQAIGHHVCVLMPAYRGVLGAARHLGVRLRHATELEGHSVRLFESRLPGSRNRLWLLDCPALFDRPGNPYHDAEGRDWPDNAQRFALLCRVAALLARDGFGLGWQADVVHCNDWQTGLVPLMLQEQSPRPAAVFTIHNLAYQGLFPEAAFRALGIPARHWHPDSLEFHGQMSFIKGGIVFADRVTTVSPTYAREIRTAAFGCGLEGLLEHRASALCGILNGIDTSVWNPLRDVALTQTFGASTLGDKRISSRALRAELGLADDPRAPLLASIGRLAEQKGVDLITAALPALLEQGAQFVLLGSGDARYEQALADLAHAYPGRVALRLGYDEGLAHRIEAGADIFLMPSRFEPCGLNQMYSLRYGTLPVVHGVGGLADTVTDASESALADGSATGFVFHAPTAAALRDAALRAIGLRREAPDVWARMQVRGMRTDFSWRASARAYEDLYASALAELRSTPPA